MEGMGVFELDPLDNILSTQISIHATLFHVDRAALGGWGEGVADRLINILRKV